MNEKQKPNKYDLNREKLMERQEMDRMNYNPFGKGGSGAPLRDEYGNIMTTRRTINNNGVYNENQYKDRGNSMPVNNIQGNNNNNIPMNVNTNPSNQYNNNSLSQQNTQENVNYPTSYNPQFNFKNEPPVRNNENKPNVPVRSNTMDYNQPPQEDVKRIMYQQDLMRQIEERKKNKQEEKRREIEMDKIEEAKYAQYL